MLYFILRSRKESPVRINTNGNYNFTDKKMLKILTTATKNVCRIFHISCYFFHFDLSFSVAPLKTQSDFLKQWFRETDSKTSCDTWLQPILRPLMRKKYFNENLAETFSWCALSTSWLKGSHRKFLLLEALANTATPLIDLIWWKALYTVRKPRP